MVMSVLPSSSCTLRRSRHFSGGSVERSPPAGCPEVVALKCAIKKQRTRERYPTAPPQQLAIRALPPPNPDGDLPELVKLVLFNKTRIALAFSFCEDESTAPSRTQFTFVKIGRMSEDLFCPLARSGLQ